MEPLLSETGHPFADVGIAALCAMVGKQQPAELTLEDLDRAAREMAEYYFGGILDTYLWCVFPNSEYVQPETGPNKAKSRKVYAERILFAHRYHADPRVSGMRCVFSGRPATHLVHRAQLPLLTGEDVLNFRPAGTAAFPISGPYLTAVQALPLGGRRCDGRLLIAHSDAWGITAELARKYVDDNRRLLAQAKLSGLPQCDGPHPTLDREQAAWDSKKKRPKYPDAKAHRSLVTRDLMSIWEEGRYQAEELGPVSVTIYWLSNRGDGPSLDIYELPSNLVVFLAKAVQPAFRRQWSRLESAGWQDPDAGRSTRAATGVRGGPGRSRNSVLNDLFAIFETGWLDLAAARRFVRRHLLSETERKIESGEQCDWSLTELFLKEVFGMDPKRVDAIRVFADRLADHIRGRNDNQLFRSVVYGRTYGEIRNALAKAQRDEARERAVLLFGLEDFLDVFEAEEAVGRVEWSLVRDLLSIRLVEQLHRAGFLGSELLAEEPVEVAEER